MMLRPNGRMSRVVLCSRAGEFGEAMSERERLMNNNVVHQGCKPVGRIARQCHASWNRSPIWRCLANR